MKIVVATEQHAQPWNDFVNHHPAAVNYVRWDWKACDGARVWVADLLFGRRGGRTNPRRTPISVAAVSSVRESAHFGAPYFSEGGVLASDPEVQALLLSEAIALAQKLNAKNLEFRQTSEINTDIPAKTDRVAMVLDINPDPRRILRSFDTKMRSNVRRSLQDGIGSRVRRNGISRRFLFDFCPSHVAILARRYIPRNSSPKFCRFSLGDFHLSSSLRRKNRQRIFYDRVSEIPSSPTGPLLYPEGKKPESEHVMAWRSMCFAATKGYTIFDFGRSSIGSPTHKFKLEWNCRTVPLFWYHWPATPETTADLDRRNPAFSAAIGMWKNYLWESRRYLVHPSLGVFRRPSSAPSPFAAMPFVSI